MLACERCKETFVHPMGLSDPSLKEFKQASFHQGWPDGHIYLGSREFDLEGTDESLEYGLCHSFSSGWPDGKCLRRRRKIGSCRRSGQAAARAQEPSRQPGNNI